MAAKYRKTDPRLWDDENFDSLNQVEALAAIWLMTTKSGNRAGVVVCSLGDASDKLRLETGAQAWDTLSTACKQLGWPIAKASRATVVVILKSWWRYNAPTNDDHLKGMMSDLADVPRCELIESQYLVTREYLSEKWHARFNELWADYITECRQGVDRLSAGCQPEAVTVAVAETEAGAEAGAETENKKRVASGDIDAVVSHYQTHHPAAKPGAKERRLIASRLKEGYSVDDLREAIEGNHRSPFHCGENQGGKKYHRLDLIMRDSSKVQDFIDMPAANAPVLSEKTRRTLRAAENFINTTQPWEVESGS